MNGTRDGGPAFPSSQSHEQFAYQNTEHLGLSLRDYFAAKALPALIGKLGHPETAAERAYAHADAMLAAREAGR